MVKRHPFHRIAHEQMLQYLCRKWFGSHEEMFAFAFCLAGEWSAAAEQFDIIGDRILAWVWGYFGGDDVQAFRNLPVDAYRFGRPGRPPA